jgi:hypothetical protein
MVKLRITKIPLKIEANDIENTRRIKLLLETITGKN